MDDRTQPRFTQPPLRFERHTPALEPTLVAWLSAERWPFHRSSTPDPAQVTRWTETGRFESADSRTFWICKAEERVGLLTVGDLQDATPVFDLRLREASRGQRIGQRALAWLEAYVFETLDRTRVEAHTRLDNLPMRAALLKRGWVQEAHYREVWPDDDGRLHDAVTYAYLRHDWRSGTVTALRDPWGARLDMCRMNPRASRDHLEAVSRHD